ncbi:putative metalloreductase transmembrane component [Penicillium brasilianum]|uniref:ferric-chelate reductase (NADPH) n=1 Tax=Penicillium brasilianum TaxID=104259 RepID=A0A1S9RBG4_PENBI|nr:putative metalloreductase transmembrane component [Penicillium brasilianum]
MDSLRSLAKRVNVVVTASTTQKEQAEMNRDPWSQSAKYGYGFVYFAIVLLVTTSLVRFYHIWGDKIRIAKFKEQQSTVFSSSPHNVCTPDEYELPSAGTDASSAHFFPAPTQLPQIKRRESLVQRVIPLQRVIALMRWIFYRPIPVVRIGSAEFVFPSLAVTIIVLAALIFVALYCFLPQPLYYWTIALGSPPLAIRAGMLAVAMVPWIVALSTKANFISMFTGLGPERLNGLHRWSAYICLFLSLVHMVPFYITPIWEDGAMINYRKFITLPNMYVYGNGLAAIVPLCVLCIHSLPFFRHKMYELFVFIHIPVSWIFVAMLFWHTKNFLSSWGYLWATVVILIVTYVIRLFYLNWTNPFHLASFMIGEESAVTLLPQGAIKVTIPTQMRWRPGQYVYLRMPSIAFFQSHPFTIASLCSDDFPSDYGEEYRDCTLVFRPSGGFTRKVFRKALENGPFRTYTAFLEGPYGGMQREMAAFDDVIFFAGGSGITAIASQLLDLIKKIRDGKAITKSVKVIWALKNAETMEWFQEELRICKDHAPAGILQCHFFLTDVKDEQKDRDIVQEKIYGMLQGIDKRNSAYIREEAGGDAEREKELRRENEDGLAALPGAHTASHITNNRHYYQPGMDPYGAGPHESNNNVPFDFGFGGPQPMQQRQPAPTPRYAYFQPGLRRDNWRTDYFRPDISQMLTEFSRSFGRRACVFVCGPPSMRVEVANTVAKLQQQVMTDSSKDEIFLHAENYNI